MKLIQFKLHDVPRVQNDITDTIVSGNPEHHAQVMYVSSNEAVRSGIWESSAGVFSADYTGIVEFCHILEGEARIKTGDGEEFHVSAGDGFILDEGLVTQWTVDKFIKKHFMITKI